MFGRIERMYFETLRFCDDLLRQREAEPLFLEGLFNDYGKLLKAIKPIFKQAEKLEKDITMNRELKERKIRALHEQMENAINEGVDRGGEKGQSKYIAGKKHE